MDFTVFESLAGSVSGISLGIGGLFVSIVMWRVGASVLGAFRQLGASELSVDEWLWFTIKVFTFLMFCGAFWMLNV